MFYKWLILFEVSLKLEIGDNVVNTILFRRNDSVPKTNTIIQKKTCLLHGEVYE